VGKASEFVLYLWYYSQSRIKGENEVEVEEERMYTVVVQSQKQKNILLLFLASHTEQPWTMISFEYGISYTSSATSSFRTRR
jgi:hypothetical protein